MGKIQSVYNGQDYWDWVIDSKYLEKGGLLPPQEAAEAVFINLSVIDHSRDVFDVRWLVLPDREALLGFLQYVFLPTAFDYVLLKEREHFELATAATWEMINYIKESASPWKDRMLELIGNVRSAWKLPGGNVEKGMQVFCEAFNSTWEKESCILDIRIFFHTREIARFVKEQIEFDELLEEDSGLSFEQFDDFCERFYTEPFVHQRFINFLNNKIGCLV